MSATSVSRPAQAPVMEVFASIQGEGLYVGEPQVFLRLRGCPMRCRWCDTPASWSVQSRDRASIRAATVRHENPLATPFQAACWISEVEPGAPRTVSVTGGEPLLWPGFLLGLKGMLGRRRVHLETAGAHPRTLARVIDVFDHVSLDLKPELDLDAPVELPSAPDLGVDSRAESALAPTEERAPRTREEWHAARAGCLALVAGRDACGKIVVSGERAPEDFLALFDEVESHAPKLTLILQPVTPVSGVRAPSRRMLEVVCEMARDRDLAVRVVPQVHRFLDMP